jgi:TrkA domain protein
MPEVKETHLPGVGTRHEFTTSGGERVAVLTHRTGRRELALYDRRDPDSCTTLLHLDADDTRVLSELLGGSPVIEAMAAAQQRVEGLAIDWVKIPERSQFVGVTIAEGDFRNRTGSSIVAIVRGAVTIAAPGPEHALEAGDVIVAVGTPEGVVELRDLLVS